MANHIIWLDIPTVDLDRAINYYSKTLAMKITKDFSHKVVGVFDHDEGEVSGCLYQSEEDKPSAGGPLIYFNVDGRLDEAIEAAKANGGSIVKDKHQIGPYGWRAVVLDSEGNRIALHSA